MIRRFGTGKLRSGVKEDEDINPMDGVGNMADAMLVLAVGIMLALVMNWNVDLGSLKDPVSVEQAQEVSEMEDLDGENVSEAAENNGLSELGRVYQDPKTGKMYMVKEKKE